MFSYGNDDFINFSISEFIKVGSIYAPWTMDTKMKKYPAIYDNVVESMDVDSHYQRIQVFNPFF